MTDEALPASRSFRYSLKTLLVVITIFAVWLGWRYNRLRWAEGVLARQDAVVAAVNRNLSYAPPGVQVEFSTEPLRLMPTRTVESLLASRKKDTSGEISVDFTFATGMGYDQDKRGQFVDEIADYYSSGLDALQFMSDSGRKYSSDNVTVLTQLVRRGGDSVQLDLALVIIVAADFTSGHGTVTIFLLGS